MEPRMRGSAFASRPSVVNVTTRSWIQVLHQSRKMTRSNDSTLDLCKYGLIFVFTFTNLYTLSKDDTSDEEVESYHQLVPVMWLVGACVGSMINAISTVAWPVNLLNYICSGIYLLLAILTMTVQTTEPFVYIVCFIAGCIGGFYYISLLSQIGDNVRKSIRGYATTLYIIQFYAFMIVLGASAWFDGKVVMLCVMIGLPLVIPILTYFFSCESITRLIKMGQEEKARQILEEFHNGALEPTMIIAEIEDKKRMVAEDYEEPTACGFCGVFSNGNIFPIIWMLLLRVLSVLTSHKIFFVLSADGIYKGSVSAMLLAILLTRLITLFFPLYAIDRLGRKPFLAISGIGCGICALPFACFNLNYIYIRADLLAIITVSMQIFIALGIEPTKHIYSVEAFPLSKRNGSLAIITCFEYICHILLIYVGNEPAILIASPFLIILLTLLLTAKLPETKFVGLRKCRLAFNTNLSQ